MVIYYIVDRYSANTEYRLSLDWLPCSRIVNIFSFFFFVFESLMIWRINFKDRSSAENKNLKLKLRMQEGSIDRSPNRSKLNQKRSNWLANSNFTSIKAHKQLNIHRRTMVRIIAVECIKLCFFDLIFRKRYRFLL